MAATNSRLLLWEFGRDDSYGIELRGQVCGIFTGWPHSARCTNGRGRWTPTGTVIRAVGCMWDMLPMLIDQRPGESNPFKGCGQGNRGFRDAGHTNPVDSIAFSPDGTHLSQC